MTAICFLLGLFALFQTIAVGRLKVELEDVRRANKLLKEEIHNLLNDTPRLRS